MAMTCSNDLRKHPWLWNLLSHDKNYYKLYNKTIAKKLPDTFVLSWTVPDTQKNQALLCVENMGVKRKTIAHNAADIMRHMGNE